MWYFLNKSWCMSCATFLSDKNSSIVRLQTESRLVKEENLSPLVAPTRMFLSPVSTILEEEKLQENSKKIGTNLLLELAKLQSEFSVIGDVRGKGLMIGIELVKPDTKEALPADKFSKFFEACLNMGLLLGKGGINGNVLRIQPPMCITKDDADFTIAVMRKAFQDL